MVTARRVRIALEATLAAMVVLVMVALLIGRLVPMTGRQTIIVGGGSMEPSIPLGSVAITEPTPASSVRVGDVVSIRAGNGAVVTHRVVRVVEREGGTWFELKGDANQKPDPVLVDSATMLGTVTATIPSAGFLLRFLSIPAAVVTVIGLGATLVLALYLLDDLAVPRRRHALARTSAASTTLPDGRVLAPVVAYRKRPRGRRSAGEGAHAVMAPNGAAESPAGPADRAAPGAAARQHFRRGGRRHRAPRQA